MTNNDYITTPEEDAYDLQQYNKAYEEYSKNPVTYTHEETAKILGITEEE